MDRFRHDHLDSDFSLAHGDSRLKEDLADAMRESPSVSSSYKEAGKWKSKCYTFFLFCLRKLFCFILYILE